MSTGSGAFTLRHVVTAHLTAGSATGLGRPARGPPALASPRRGPRCGNSRQRFWPSRSPWPAARRRGPTTPNSTAHWKLSVLPFGDDEFLILDVKAADGKPAGTVISAQPFLGPLEDGRGRRQGRRPHRHVPGAGRADGLPRHPQGRQGAGDREVPRQPVPGPAGKDRGQEVGRSRRRPSRMKVMQAQQASRTRRSGSPGSSK